MTILSIIRMGDQRLLQVAEPVWEFNTAELNVLITDMVETMKTAGGVGLAAPQLGISQQVVIFGFEQSPRYLEAPPVPLTILINPMIAPLSNEEEDGWEGCLSVPRLRGMVPRWKQIRYQRFDQYGNPIDRVVDGFHARVVQHECDHLIGKLYPMRMRDFTRFGFTEVLFPELEAGAGPLKE